MRDRSQAPWFLLFGLFFFFATAIVDEGTVRNKLVSQFVLMSEVSKLDSEDGQICVMNTIVTTVKRQNGEFDIKHEKVTGRQVPVDCREVGYLDKEYLDTSVFIGDGGLFKPVVDIYYPRF